MQYSSVEIKHKQQNIMGNRSSLFLTNLTAVPNIHLSHSVFILLTIGVKITSSNSPF